MYLTVERGQDFTPHYSGANTYVSCRTVQKYTRKRKRTTTGLNRRATVEVNLYNIAIATEFVRCTSESITRDYD